MEKANVTVFETKNFNAAGIDIGAEKIFVSPNGKEVVNFATYTADYYKCVEYLQTKGCTSVAMEATGVYWIALYSMLEACGLKVCLVNPKETKQIKGRKTDVMDCQHIQKLYSAGLLRESFVPKTQYMEIRQLVRARQSLIEMGSSYILRMQKNLELMNIKLKQVISQIHGASGIKMIKAIIEGERNKEYLLSLCDRRIQDNKSEEILKALEGTYNETYLFLLKENLKMWELHEEEIGIIDEKIQELLKKLVKDKRPMEVISKPKRIRHHKPEVKDFHNLMVQVYGVDMSSISGFNDYTLLRLVGETGINIQEHFPSEKQFVSWCGLSPRHHQSGKKRKQVKTISCNQTGQIFKEIAQSLINSKKIAIGAFIRRIKLKRDTGIAIKAGARKLASAYYNCLTKGIAYVEQGNEKYKEQLKQREIRTMKRLALKYNVEFANNGAVT